MGRLTSSVLITRTLPGASASAAELNKLGYSVFINPVLVVHRTTQSLPDIDGVQAIITTSAHGVGALADCQNAPPLALYCLSGASLGTAKAGNFSADLHPCAGNAADIVIKIQKELSPDHGPVLWVRGHHFAFDVKAALTAQGFEVREWEAYEAHPARALSTKTLQAFGKGQIKAVLFHSARGAETFVTLAKSANLPLRSLCAITISAAAAAPLENAGFKAIHTAKSPNEAAMLEAVRANIAGI